MPPKRRHKAATKPAPATQQPAAHAAGAIRTSLIKRRRSSVQGGKTSTSRLQPSEPLHMTTRRALKAVSARTSPGVPSVADGSSRRSSLNNISDFQDDHSNREDGPAKPSRASTESGSPPNQMPSFVSQLPVGEPETNSASRAISNSPKSSGKKRRASGGSSETSNTVSNHPNGPLTRSESDLSEKPPARKKRKTTETPPDPEEAPPELTDSSTPPGSPEAIPEPPNSQGLQNVLPAVNGEMPAKAARRLPGRRRQPHSDINIEADLRRQLSIKMGYRSLAKIQKVILEELSNRTTRNLENDPEFHKQCPEYDYVMAELDRHRKQRIDQLDAERRAKLDQLERVRIAEEHIQRQQYINRFQELQDDFVLQCFYRLKQLERQMKMEAEDATDDEERIVAPTTRVEFPMHDTNDVLGSKYASRSRAYVETERMLEGEGLRRRFDQCRKAFLAENQELDDSIDSGFASFVGPDRAEALAHYNVASLVDAAAEVEKIPPEPEPAKVIPNEQADALFFLASLSESVERPSESLPQNPVINVGTPAQQMELQREVSPVEPLSSASTAMSLDTAKSSPSKALDGQEEPVRETPQQETNGIAASHEADVVKIETPPRKSTHRIVDILNEDQDVQLPKMRESRESQPPSLEQGSRASPSRHEDTGYSKASPHRSYPMDDAVPPQDEIPHSHPEHLEDESRRRRSRSPSTSTQFWSSRNMSASSEALNDTRNPLDRVKQMLDRRAEQHRTQEQSTSTARDRSDEYRDRRESVDRHPMAPPLSRPFSPPERPTTEIDSRRPSLGAYSATSSTGPTSYERSPHDQHHAHLQPARQSSYDSTGRSHWEQDRHMGNSHGPLPPQSGGSPSQPYATPEYGRAGPTPPSHHSPYPPPGPQQLPSFNHQPQHSLPPKPPAPQINFRFAHYDPAPPRASSYQQAPYPSTPHPAPPAGSPPSHYGQPHYAGHMPHQGYVPPPGSFQAPPPPPQPTAITPYPPLKIHQYGGQPILPANMAPPHQPSQSPYPSYSPSPHASYSPQPQQPPPHTHFHSELSPAPPAQERPENQSRPRRPYRSYHAPGTEFRTYQGPNQRGRRT